MGAKGIEVQMTDKLKTSEKFLSVIEAKNECAEVFC